MSKRTEVIINLKNLEYNAKSICEKFKDYKYRIGVLKSNAYGHGYKVVNSFIKGGINYIAVSYISEALEIRKYNKDIGILCTEIIDVDFLDVAIKNNITLTIDSINYLKNISMKCKIHIKVNSGMNRLGVSTKEEFNDLIKYIKSHDNLYLEGIYTHFATPGINDIYYDKQLDSFKNITSDIDLNSIDIVHLSSSFILVSHPKIEFANGIRIGTIMYGYDVSLNEYGSDIKSVLKKTRDNYLIKKNNISPVIRGNNIELKPALKVITNVMEIRKVKKGSLLGYGVNTLNNDSLVAILPIGYEDGIGTNMNGRKVIINDKIYNAISNIEMCMMFVCVDDSVKVGDKVIILGDKLTLGYMSRLNNMGIQGMLSTIGQRLERVYIKDNKRVEIN